MKCFPQAANINTHTCQFFSTTHFVPFLPILFQELFSIEPLYNNWSHTSSNFPLYSKNVDIHCLFSHLCTKLCTISTRKCAITNLSFQFQFVNSTHFYFLIWLSQLSLTRIPHQVSPAFDLNLEILHHSADCKNFFISRSRYFDTIFWIACVNDLTSAKINCHMTAITDDVSRLCLGITYSTTDSTQSRRRIS